MSCGSLGVGESLRTRCPFTCPGCGTGWLVFYYLTNAVEFVDCSACDMAFWLDRAEGRLKDYLRRRRFPGACFELLPQDV